ncbi:MAG: translation initiation factor IF-3 [Omnitrophica bacterium RBG_13_46_9]|nr:MAG: translation initiation factor IF-3 [Omnitrophica bacterium RBG_13_46_9]
MRIRAQSVRLIGEDGRQFGVVDIREALRIAGEAGLDLVEVAPNVNPPVCRIMDYSKFKYEQEKREREAKKKQHIIHIKELKFGPKIEEHDYQVKLHHLQRFVERGDKVKITMQFRGRQMEHIDIGRSVLQRLIRDISEIAAEEYPLKLEGRIMTTVIVPKINKQ